ncbi:MAG: hypothetical protein Q8M17_14050 [Actinomycetota bacterium]|nr:hypothetical protein [Actinomycetota bacterium]
MRWIRGVASVGLALGVVGASPAIGRAQPAPLPEAGYRDVTFASSGIARLPVMQGSRAVDIEQSADGSLLVLVDELAPGGRHRPLLWRLHADGSVDRTYGDEGTASPVLRESFRPVAIVPTGDGAVLLAGDIERGVDRVPGVARVRADGRADGDFGRAGLVAGGKSGVFSVEDATASPRGLVLVGGSGRNGSDLGTGLLGRLDGKQLTLETLGGGGGTARLRAVAATGSGAYVATGVADLPGVGLGFPLFEFTLAAKGEPLQLVSTFANGTGWDPTEGCQFDMSDVVMQGERIITVGTAYLCDGVPDSFGSVAARYLSTGLSDLPFGASPGETGEGAILAFPGPGFWWSGRAAAVDSQGRIVVVGTAYATSAGQALPHDVSTPRVLSYRLQPDGVADTTFAMNALALRDSAWSWYGEDVVLTASDDVVVVGTARSESSTQVRVVKLYG